MFVRETSIDALKKVSALHPTLVPSILPIIVERDFVKACGSAVHSHCSLPSQAEKSAPRGACVRDGRGLDRTQESVRAQRLTLCLGLGMHANV